MDTLVVEQEIFKTTPKQQHPINPWLSEDVKKGKLH